MSATTTAAASALLLTAFANQIFGASATATVGTPPAKVAVAVVASTTFTEVASCPPNEALAAYPAVKKSVPVKVIVESSVFVTAETAGNGPVASYS